MIRSQGYTYCAFSVRSKESLVDLDPDPKAPDRTGRMVRTDRFKYIVFSHGQR